MKKTSFTILASLLALTPTYLKADIETEVFSGETIQPPKQFPYGINYLADLVTRTKVKNTEEYQHFTYRYSEIEASMVFYHNPCFHEAALITLGYNFADTPWHNNPFFQQDHFETINIAAAVNTKRIKRWDWTLQGEINIDANHFEFGHYAYYDLLFWGRYTYTEDIGVHVGLFVEAGMKINWVYPIIGFDWQATENLKLNLVFPMNMSLVYQWNKMWSFAIETRFFDVRYRLNKHEPLSQGLLVYQNIGLEAAVLYNWNDRLTSNLHVGSTMGGRLKVADKHYHHKRHFDLDPSAYFGGEIEYRF